MAETATVMSNTAQIHQMVMNLCHNACEAMPEGGILDVYLDEIYLDSNLSAQMENIPEGPYAKLTVKDTGSGMTDEIAERIFDPFFTTKTSKEGAGMGLSIVHGIVKRYNGAISVETREGGEPLFKFSYR